MKTILTYALLNSFSLAPYRHAPTYQHLWMISCKRFRPAGYLRTPNKA
jgi:hypothetical protein